MHEPDSDHNQKRKRTLRDVSHHFFSSLDERRVSGTLDRENVKGTAPAGPPVSGECQLPAQQSVVMQRFTPSLQMMSILPVERMELSLFYHVQFAKLFLHSPYRVCIVSTNPHQESWSRLERLYELPSRLDAGIDTTVKTFTLYPGIELLISPPALIGDFFTFQQMPAPGHPFGDGEGKHAVVLADFWNCTGPVFEKLIALIDCFLIMSAPDISEVRTAYKALKALAPWYPQAIFKYIVRGKDDAGLRQMVGTELNRLTTTFLHMPVETIGYAEEVHAVEGNNIRWSSQERTAAFSVDLDFLTAVKKTSWTEEVLSVYQTMMSYVKW